MEINNSKVVPFGNGEIMTGPLRWETSLGDQEKMQSLKVDPIPGVLPFDGSRNPLTRSDTASRVSMTIITPAIRRFR